MKRNLLVLSACVLAFAFASCSSTPRVSRVEVGGATSDLSGFWSAADVRIISENLIADALASPRLDAYVNNFSARNGGGNPTVIVGRFVNNSHEHIDTAIISSNMRTAIINSGRLSFVEGGDMREDIRAERQDQQWNASEDTAAALGAEIGADFMLTGDVRTIVDMAGNMMVRTYFVTATITSIETNLIIWEGQDSVQKLTQRPRTRL